MFSIIVAIYRVEDYLPQCIESILKQTYNDFELILVDDGSPDGAPLICDEYAKKDRRVKVIHKKNGGLVSARKAGLKIARGKYICFVDGDDFVSNDMLETYERTLRRQNVDVICAGHSEFYGNGEVIKVQQKAKNGFYDKKDLQTEFYHQMLSTKPFFHFYVQPSVWSKCFKKQIADMVYRNIPDDISLGEDVAATYAILLRAASVRVIDYCGYMYRQNIDSMTHTYDKNLYPKVRNLVEYLKKLEKETEWQAKNQINEYAVYLLILAKDNEFKYNSKETYRQKKKNMKNYLSDPLFKEALKRVKMDGLKNRFIVHCFKKQLLFPIYLYETMQQKGNRNEKKPCKKCNT